MNPFDLNPRNRQLATDPERDCKRSREDSKYGRSSERRMRGNPPCKVLQVRLYVNNNIAKCALLL